MAKQKLVTRPNNPCENEHCGNTLYEVTFRRKVTVDTEEDYNFVLEPIFKCTNCLREYERHTRNRPTNKRRALDLRKAIEADWKETDDRLHALVAAGKAKGGAVLAYGSTFNYHLDKLLMLEKPTNFEVGYHSSQARADLEKAKRFVAEKENEDTVNN